MNDAHSARADACAPEATGGLTRRDIAKIGAWAVPAVMMATALPAAAASGPRRYNVLVVRANGPGWEGTGASDAPGMRFTTSSEGPSSAIILFTPEGHGAVPNPGVIFNTFSDGGDGKGLTIVKSDSSYLVTGLLVDSTVTKGITMKSVAEANGTFTVTYGNAAGFVISSAGTASPKVRHI